MQLQISVEKIIPLILRQQPCTKAFIRVSPLWNPLARVLQEILSNPAHGGPVASPESAGIRSLYY